MIDRQTLLDWPFPEIEHRYTQRDTMLYALAVGIGADPCDEAQLRFVNDRPTAPLALPTMAAVLGFPGPWMQDPATGIDYEKIVHGEEEIVFHQPLPADGTIIARHVVTNVIDKGPGRGAIITYDKTLHDTATGLHLATVRHTTFARGDGGFSGIVSGAPAIRRQETRDVFPERAYEIHSLAQQALLYRLLGDINPLHSDPATARRAGFSRPILHGLCSYGMACYAILADWCDHEPDRLASLRLRFANPVYPGERLLVESWRTEGGIGLQARVLERNVVVLSNGHAVLRK